jgi:hypothetical protein
MERRVSTPPEILEQLDDLDFSQEPAINTHYSKKNGHRQRSFFWRNQIRLAGGSTEFLPDKGMIFEEISSIPSDCHS